MQRSINIQRKAYGFGTGIKHRTIFKVLNR